MTNFHLKAVRIQLYALIVALLIAVVSAAGGFVLSFAVLRDVAFQATGRSDLAWIFPAIVAAAILAATVGFVLLTRIRRHIAGKWFFLLVAVSVVCASIYMNVSYTYLAAEEAHRKIAAGIDLGFTPLAPEGAALIAAIPPLLALALTYGICVLILAIRTAYAEYNDLLSAAADALDDADRPELIAAAAAQ